MGTDRDWEQWGRTDPYFGVLSTDRFRGSTLSTEARQEFFVSGERHVESVLGTIRTRIDAGFAPRHALDFGCGVGRLVMPLAARCEATFGVDVSRGMLAEAERNCAERDLRNVSLVQSIDALPALPEGFDLVHSYIVLQHIPPGRGHLLLAALASRVALGGVLAVQIPYRKNSGWLVNSLTWLRYRLPPLNMVRNLLRGRPVSEPAMQLHAYDLRRVLHLLKGLGFGTVLLLQDEAAGKDFDSLFLFAQREAGRA